MRHNHLFLSLALLSSLSYGTANAAVVATAETDVAPAGTGVHTPTFTAGNPSSSDILEGIVPTAQSGNFEQEASTGVAALTNGTVETQYGTGTAESNHTAYATAGENSSLTYSLSGTYDISSISVFGGWNDAGRDAQGYEIYTSTDGAVNFTLLTSFDNENGAEQGVVTTPVSHRVDFTEDTLSELAASITHLRFDFLSVENGYTGYTEIDVFGTPLFLPGDADRDGDVDIDDFNLISDNFLSTPSSPGLDGDVFTDNIVDVKDFRLWKANASPATLALLNGTAVPEPASAIGLTLALLASCGIRRRQ